MPNQSKFKNLLVLESTLCQQGSEPYTIMLKGGLYTFVSNN